MSIELAKLSATFFYLNELQKLRMVTPSIAKPYPNRPISEERKIAHDCSRKIQQVRMNKIRAEVAALRADNIPVCRKTLLSEKSRLRRKIEFLKRKHQPEPVTLATTLATTKLIKKEFEEVNTLVLNALNSNTKKHKFNLPTKVRNSIAKLKVLVKDKVIDIRKVDKGELILIIDYSQRAY